MSADTNFDQDASPRWEVVAAAIFLGVVLFLHFTILTPLTYSLDDIKHATMWIGGALSLVIFGVLLFTGSAKPPPALVTGAYLAYLGVMVLSTLFGSADYARWIGWQSVLTQLSLAGYFFLATAVAPTVGMVRRMTQFWVLLVLVTCGFGLLHYAGMMEGIASSLESAGRRPDASGFDRGLYNLALSFARERSMLSTILNTQFFANFLVMLLPVTVAFVVLKAEDVIGARDGGLPVARPMGLLVAGAVALVIGTFCALLTYSKVVLLLPVSLVGVLVLVQVLTRYNVLKIPAWPVALVLLALAGATLTYFAWGDFMARFRSVDQSMDSRTIIYGGAWAMFADNPVFGAGPGAFRLEFPSYRSPDYHMSDISNVTLYAHNFVLDLLAETGALGFLAFVAFLAGCGWVAGRAALGSPDHGLRVLAAGYALGALGLYLTNLATPMLRWPVGSVAGHAIVGCLVAVAVTGLEGNRFTGRYGGLPAPALRRAGMALMILGVPFFLWSVSMTNSFFTASRLNAQGMMRTESPIDLANLTPERTQMAMGLFMEGAELYEQAIERRPTFLTAYYKVAHAYNRMGVILAQEGDKQGAFDMQRRALDAYERLQAFAPDYSEVHFNLAVVRERLAADMLATTEEPGFSGDRAALRAEAMGLYAEAVEAIERAMELSNKITVHFVGGRLYSEYARRLPEGDPLRRELNIKAGEAWERARDLPVSRVRQMAAQEERERGEASFSAGAAARAYVAAGDEYRAARAYEALFTAEPGRTEHLERAVIFYERSGHPGDADRLLDRAVELNPLNYSVYVLRGEVALRRAMDGDSKEAVESLRREVAFLEALARQKDDAATTRDLQRVGVLREELRKLQRMTENL